MRIKDNSECPFIVGFGINSSDDVEGEQLAREIAPFILKKINKQKIPLMVNLIRTIQSNKKLNIKV